MAYLLDANVFIEAKNRHYGMDFAPGFWDWLVLAHDDDRALSVEKVGNELKNGGDNLASWATGRPGSFFKVADAADVASLSAVATWVTSQSYSSAEISRFMQAADFYLVAQALTGGHTVVTHEASAPLAKKVKIPNVCIGVGVKHITPFDMLRTENVRLILG